MEDGLFGYSKEEKCEEGRQRVGRDQYSPCCATSTVLLSLSSLRNAVKVVSFTPTEIKQEKSISGLT